MNEIEAGVLALEGKKLSHGAEVEGVTGMTALGALETATCAWTSAPFTVVFKNTT